VADLRLLAVLLVVMLALPSCALFRRTRVIEVPRIAGQAVDAKTRQPIAGAHILAVRDMSRSAGFLGHGAMVKTRDSRWAQADETGRFEFPPYLDEVAPADQSWAISSYPGLYLVSPDYGVVYYLKDVSRQPTGFVWEVTPDEYWVRGSSTADSECEAPDHARCCEILTGDPRCGVKQEPPW
jgi:hypothetical protein